MTAHAATGKTVVSEFEVSKQSEARGVMVCAFLVTTTEVGQHSRVCVRMCYQVREMSIYSSQTWCVSNLLAD